MAPRLRPGFRRTLVRLKHPEIVALDGPRHPFQTNSREVEAQLGVLEPVPVRLFQTNSREVEAPPTRARGIRCRVSDELS